MNHKDAPTAEEQESSKETATEAAEEAMVTGGKKVVKIKGEQMLSFLDCSNAVKALPVVIAKQSVKVIENINKAIKLFKQVIL